MNTTCRIAGGLMILLVGAALAASGVELWRRGPGHWPEMIADEKASQRVSIGMLASAALAILSGTAVLFHASWGAHAASIAILVIVAGAFWAHHTLFGDFRPLKTGSNVVLGAVILWLLWKGYQTEMPAAISGGQTE